MWDNKFYFGYSYHYYVTFLTLPIIIITIKIFLIIIIGYVSWARALHKYIRKCKLGTRLAEDYKKTIKDFVEAQLMNDKICEPSIENLCFDAKPCTFLLSLFLY